MAFGSNMNGCGHFIKTGLFVLNIISCIGGFIAIGLGIWTIVDKSFANELLGTNLYGGTSWIMVVTGLFVVIISCVGCLGAIKEVRCFLFLYIMMYFFIFVTMLAGGIIGYVFREKAEITIRNGMTSSLRAYGNYYPVTAAWDETQQRLKCCGIDTYRDWKNFIPNSCCKAVRGIPQKCTNLETQNDFTLYTRGCWKATLEYVQENAFVMGTVCVIVSFILIVGIIFAFALFRIFRRMNADYL